MLISRFGVGERNVQTKIQIETQRTKIRTCFEFQSQPTKFTLYQIQVIAQI